MIKRTGGNKEEKKTGMKGEKAEQERRGEERGEGRGKARGERKMGIPLFRRSIVRVKYLCYRLYAKQIEILIL